jgi:hypothetical protein
MATLEPTGKVTLGSTAKFFRKGEPTGASTGSEELIEYTVVTEPGEQVSPGKLSRLILEAKRGMDERTLLTEYLRGTLTADELKDRRLALKLRYAKALGTIEDLA